MKPNLDTLRESLEGALLDLPWVDEKAFPGEVKNTADLVVEVVEDWLKDHEKAEDGPTQQQIEDAMNWAAPEPMQYLDKDTLCRGGIR